MPNSFIGDAPQSVGIQLLALESTRRRMMKMDFTGWRGPPACRGQTGMSAPPSQRIPDNRRQTAISSLAQPAATSADGLPTREYMFHSCVPLCSSKTTLAASRLATEHRDLAQQESVVTAPEWGTRAWIGYPAMSTDAQRLDHRARTEFRHRAVASVQEGQHPEAVARAMGLAAGGRLNAHHPDQGSDIVDNLSRSRLAQAGQHAHADDADGQNNQRAMAAICPLHSTMVLGRMARRAQEHGNDERQHDQSRADHEHVADRSGRERH